MSEAVTIGSNEFARKFYALLLQQAPTPEAAAPEAETVSNEHPTEKDTE